MGRALVSRLLTPALFVTTMAALLVKLTGCSGDDPVAGGPAPPGEEADGGGGGGGAGPVAPGPSRGSPIAISADDTTIVSVNRDSGSVTVFRATFHDDGRAPTLAEVAEVAVGAEPWQVAIAPDGSAAYVVVRKDQKLVRVGDLKTAAPRVTGFVAVGSEPTAVALTPRGGRAWVANWVDGTVVGIDTASMQITSTIDLNATLADSKLLGEVAARPSLAHPRSIAITNDGNDDENDETLYATEYYAQRIEAEAENGANADVAKAGIVYKVDLGAKTASTIRLAPIADMGFKDSAGGQAGCYPNQLQSITIQSGYAYVASVCASPKGPIGVVAPPGQDPNVSNVKTTTHGAVSVIDLASGKEVSGATASLHHRFDQSFASRQTPDDGSRRYPAVPSDVGFVAGGGVAYVVANASDAVFRVRYDVAQASAIAEVGTPSVPFINLNPAGIAADKSGQNPIGIATPFADAHKRFSFVVNDVSRNVSVIDFNAQALAGASVEDASVVRASALPVAGSLEEKVRKGKRFFDTATGRWSLKGQGWNGCQSCHMDGLSDNVTWFFARGPRQSTSLDGSFSKKNPDDQRIFNWTAIFDEVADFENNTRGISGGVGAIVHTKPTPPAGASAVDRIDLAGLGHQNLAGSTEQLVDLANPLGLEQPNVLSDWEEIKAFVQAIRPPRRPTNLDGAKVATGRQVFLSEGSCQGCHGGDKWTISSRFYTPSIAQNDALAATVWAPPAGFPAALLPADDQRFMRFSPGAVGAFDQIQCILRPVGTFGRADGVLGRATELRQDMTTPGQGDEANGKGYNPPSLLGVQVGAPYLHGGGAATLESLFAEDFAPHMRTIAANMLTDSDDGARKAKVDALVQYLLSIDADQAPTTIPVPAGAQGGDFCAK